MILPGLNDERQEVDELCRFIDETRIDMVQWRNIALDPEYYLKSIKCVSNPLIHAMMAIIATDACACVCVCVRVLRVRACCVLRVACVCRYEPPASVVNAEKLGVRQLMQAVRDNCPHVRHGYYNPCLDEKAHGYNLASSASP
jgi:hypothetical protein